MPKSFAFTCDGVSPPPPQKKKTKQKNWYNKPSQKWVSGWMSEWVCERGREFNSLSRTADSEVHVIHISHVIITYTLELLSSLTWITHNLQDTINLWKNKWKRNTKNERTHLVALSFETAPRHQFTISHLSHSLTEIEPHNAIKEQPEDIILDCMYYAHYN